VGGIVAPAAHPGLHTPPRRADTLAPTPRRPRIAINKLSPWLTSRADCPLPTCAASFQGLQYFLFRASLPNPSPQPVLPRYASKTDPTTILRPIYSPPAVNLRRKARKCPMKAPITRPCPARRASKPSIFTLHIFRTRTLAPPEMLRPTSLQKVCSHR
jgi:hypothetical protein